jgi:hypothetical protein
MNSEQQRIAIAEACGWTVSANGWWSHPTLPDNGGAMPDAPDYLNCLNAMHEVEKALNNVQRERYRTELVYSHAGTDVFATASQRAEAFLRTIGKWEEDK